MVVDELGLIVDGLGLLVGEGDVVPGMIDSLVVGVVWLVGVVSIVGVAGTDVVEVEVEVGVCLDTGTTPRSGGARALLNGEGIGGVPGMGSAETEDSNKRARADTAEHRYRAKDGGQTLSTSFASSAPVELGGELRPLRQPRCQRS
jgi:hypothetical protein